MNGRIKHEMPNTRLSLPRVGKIKIGKKELSKTGKEYPVSVDYFIPSGKYAGLFTQAYGERPNTIQIMFPDADASKVCNEEYEYRNDKGELIAKGDGENFKVWNGKQYADYSVEQYPDLMQKIALKHPNQSVRNGGDGWRVRLTLNFIIPMVKGIAGVWTFETNGTASTIPQVRDTFDAIAERGNITGVVFDLCVKFATSQKPDVRSRYPVVSLVPNMSQSNVEIIKEAMQPILIAEK